MAVSEADSAGWMLISTVNLLAAEGETLVEVIRVANFHFFAPSKTC